MKDCQQVVFALNIFWSVVFWFEGKGFDIGHKFKHHECLGVMVVPISILVNTIALHCIDDFVQYQR